MHRRCFGRRGYCCAHLLLDVGLDGPAAILIEQLPVDLEPILQLFEIVPYLSKRSALSTATIENRHDMPRCILQH